jgi:hypothetical protein
MDQPVGSATTTGQSEPDVCHAASEINTSLEEFARAVNEGDRGKLETLVSSAAQWFSLTTSKGHEVVYGQSDIVEHLTRMHAAGDRFITVPTPNQVSLRGWDGAGHFGLAEFTFERGGERLQLDGKGELWCGGRWRGIGVLSLGGSGVRALRRD